MQGRYSCWPESAFSRLEPPSLRPTQDIRLARQEKILSGCFTVPNWKWRKAVLASEPSKVIGHAVWQIPQQGQDGHLAGMNIWRYAAIDALDIRKKTGWTDDEIREMWASVDLKQWEGEFEHEDDVREKVMGEEPHWFLTILWVLPEYGGRGIAGMLLKEVIEDADRTGTPMYLATSSKGRPVYERFGWRSVEGNEDQMVRRGPINSGQ